VSFDAIKDIFPPSLPMSVSSTLTACRLSKSHHLSSVRNVRQKFIGLAGDHF
jgi:hypothetical protein